MVQLGHRLNLKAETQAGFVGEKMVGLHHLKGDNTVQPELTRAIDDPHPSAANLLDDLVIAKKA
jgi:hypothetical protein